MHTLERHATAGFSACCNSDTSPHPPWQELADKVGLSVSRALGGLRLMEKKPA